MLITYLEVPHLKVLKNTLTCLFCHQAVSLSADPLRELSTIMDSQPFQKVTPAT
jgi:hypothetical protein